MIIKEEENEKNILCFAIENKQLYHDKTLIYFNDIPLFFICIDEKGNYYLVLCTNTDTLEYVIFIINKKYILEMLIQKRTIRETLLKAEKFWNIKTEKDINEDIIECKNISDINCDILPAENVMLDISNNDMSDYIKKITNNFLR